MIARLPFLMPYALRTGIFCLMGCESNTMKIIESEIDYLISRLEKIVSMSLNTYNENTYNYSAGYRRCALDILNLIKKRILKVNKLKNKLTS